MIEESSASCPVSSSTWACARATITFSKPPPSRSCDSDTAQCGVKSRPRRSNLTTTRSGSKSTSSLAMAIACSWVRSIPSVWQLRETRKIATRSTTRNAIRPRGQLLGPRAFGALSASMRVAAKNEVAEEVREEDEPEPPQPPRPVWPELQELDDGEPERSHERRDQDDGCDTEKPKENHSEIVCDRLDLRKREPPTSPVSRARGRHRTDVMGEPPRS